ncbi:MAG: PASTA domain-containing protein [Actinomycetota bacterium]|nr:PASTA domain-containing protein [Actinomycetota bacterium]
MVDKDQTLIGTLLEQRYRVDAPVARGGMSAVYRGLDTRLDRPVAIKVMDRRFADDKSFVERFEREARSAAKIHHPHVVAVHDQGFDGEHVYLVMELVSGATLRDLIAERGALPVPLAVAIMEPMLSALAAAHAAGLIHRDVKPENVLIGQGGVVKVADFGLVRAIASVGSTKSNVILGTVAYLSPEQVTTGAATSRGDVYSAGIVLYEMLTGTPPYRGDNPLSVAYRHVNDDVPPPSARVAGIPPLLDELVLRATRRDPAARPIDGATFLNDLRRVRAALALPHAPVPVPIPASTDKTIPVPDISDITVINRPSPAEPAATSVEEADPEATIKVHTGSLPVPPAVPPSPTIMRQVAPGFSAMGPQGTRAMLRSDLEKVIESATTQPPPQTGPHQMQGQQYPQSGRIPLPPPGPPQGPPQPPQRPAPNPKRRVVLMSIVGVLVLALAGTATWWFTSGRYTSIPSVQGQNSATAEQALREAGLNPAIDLVRHNDIQSGVAIGTEPGSGVEALRGDAVTLIVSAGKPVVPDVQAGSTVAQAEQAIRDADLQPQLDDGKNVFDDKIPKGQVVKLEPGAGTQLDIGERVVVQLSRGPEPKPIPDVRGKTRDEAFQTLQGAGFEPYDGPPEFAGDVDGGKVIRTDPGARTKIQPGASKRVAVIVSTSVTVPDLQGKTAQEAQAELSALGLPLELQPFSNPNGRVYIQGPSAGQKVPKGTKVAVFTI